MGADIRTRRVYDDASPGDGTRVLVDRYGPVACARTRHSWTSGPKTSRRPPNCASGMATTRPSSTSSAAATPPNWPVPARSEALGRLRALASDGPVTLLTATKDLGLSQAAVLAGLLQETT